MTEERKSGAVLASREVATATLTVGQAIVRYLGAQVSQRDDQRQRLIPAMFGIFGHGNVAGLGQALAEHPGVMPYHQTRNEQSMVHTAIGYARATNRRATLACTSSIGPGATNMITGAATATINRLPVLLLPSDYYATRHQGTVLQQLEHPAEADVSVNDCFRPVSRFFDRISRPEQLLTALPEAMRVLTDPVETGAVTLSLPQDVQTMSYPFPRHFFDERIWRIERRAPDATRIAEAVRLIAAAKWPVIIAGGGVHYSEAWAELRAFVDTTGIPLVETFAGKGSLQEQCDLLLGGGGVNGTSAAVEIAASADLVIAIGTRLSDFTTGSQSLFRNPDVRFIAINVVPKDAHKEGALPIVADARLALVALSAAVASVSARTSTTYREEIAQAKRRWDGVLRDDIDLARADEQMSQGQLIRTLNDVARRGDCVLSAAGGFPGDLQKVWDATGGRDLILEFGNSCMGWEIPAAIGARMARPRGEVYAVVGDGTYLMNPSEIVTALQERLKITIVISDNHGFQIIRNLQMGRVGHHFGNEFRARDGAGILNGEYLPIDFVANAASMGAKTWRADSIEALRNALAEARDADGPCVIVVETEPHRYLPGTGAWWDVSVAEVSSDPTTRSLREEFEQARRERQRLHY